MQFFSDFISGCLEYNTTSKPESLDEAVAYWLCRIYMHFKLGGSDTTYGGLQKQDYQTVQKNIFYGFSKFYY